MTSVALFLLFAAAPLPCQAQPFQGTEVFGGYSFLRDNTSSSVDPFIDCLAQSFPVCDNRFGSNVGLNGWQAALTENVTKRLGVTEELAGYYGTRDIKGASHGFNTFSVLAGPRLSYPHFKSFTPFAHALFGYGQTRASEGSAGLITDRSFAFALGGGLDVNVTSRLGIRLFQADYYRTKIFSGTQNNVRISAGFIFHFGK
jgi:opacity protein-like surface antigen